MYKKISAALSIIILLGLFPIIPIQNNPIIMKNAYAQTFPDVYESDDYYEAVENLYASGIISGFDDGDFHPENNVTRAQVARMIVSAMDEEEMAQKLSNKSSFSDVSVNHWASGYISACVELGILSGMGDGTFAPDDNVTYYQMYKIVVCMEDREEEALSVGGWPTGYWNTAHFYDYTNGLHDLSINDEGPAIRGHVAILLNNILNNFGNRYSENKIEYVYGTQFIESTEKNNTLVNKDKGGKYYEFKNADENLKNLNKGDIFVIEPCDLIPAGLAVKVKDINQSGNNVRIYRDDLAFDEVIEDIDIADSVPIRMENITLGEGVTVQAIEDIEFESLSSRSQNKVTPVLLASTKGGLSGSAGLQFKVKYNNNGFKINGTVKLLNPTFSVDIRSMNNIDFKVDTVSSIDVEISKTKSDKETFRKSLGNVTVPIGTTGLFGKYEVFLDIDVKGSAKVSFEEKTSGGFKIQGKKIMPIKSVKNATTVDAEAGITVTGQIGMDAAVSLLEVFTIGLEGGAGVEVSAKTNTKAHECTLCLDGDIAPFMKIGVFAELGYGKLSFRPVDIPVSLKGKVNAFYISWRNNKSEFGWGDCPYMNNSNADNTNNGKKISANNSFTGAGNYINGGFATSDGKNIYYSADGCLWRTELDGNNKVKITEGTFEDIIIDSDNNMIYATKLNGLMGSSVYKMKNQENATAENVTGSNYNLIGIYDGYIYYYGENSYIVTDAHICKKPLDSSDWNDETVLQDCISVYGMYDSRIYYLSNDDKLYALNLDNSKKSLIYDDYFSGYNFVNDKIYFTDLKSIYCMDLDGNNVKLIYAEETIGANNNFDRNRIESLNIVDNTIYYIHLYNSKWEICKVDMDGQKRTVVNDDWEYSLCIAGGKFFGRSSMDFAEVHIASVAGKGISNTAYKTVATYGDYSVVEENAKFGVVDNKDNILVPLEYDDTSLNTFTRAWDDNFKNGYFILSKEGKYGVIDKNGKTIVPFKYFHVYGSNPPYLFEADKTMVGTMGSQSSYVDYYDKHGKKVTEKNTINKYFGDEAIMNEVYDWLNRNNSTPTHTPKPTPTQNQTTEVNNKCSSCNSTNISFDNNWDGFLYTCQNCGHEGVPNGLLNAYTELAKAEADNSDAVVLLDSEMENINKSGHPYASKFLYIYKDGRFGGNIYVCWGGHNHEPHVIQVDNSSNSDSASKSQSMGPHCPNCGSERFESIYSDTSSGQFKCSDCGTIY